MLGRPLDGPRIASAGLLSLVVHLGALTVSGALLARCSREMPPLAQRAFVIRAPDQIVEIDLPTMSDGAIEGKLVELPSVLVPRGGGEHAPRPDMDRRGRGGSDTTNAPATNLADRDDRLSLISEVPSRIDRNQVQRIDAGEARASREDYRASREPMELTFLASGRTGSRPERRLYAVHDPSSGANALGRATQLGGALGMPPVAPGVSESPTPLGGASEGASVPSMGRGVRDGAAGEDARLSAEVALARPMVAQGTPSVPAEQEGKPKDNTDSEQEVALALQSIVHASTAGGSPGVGSGGQTGLGPTGSGGERGAGSVSEANGAGQGSGTDVNALDRRRTDYLRRVKARIHPLWANAFPKWAKEEGRGGTVIISFVIGASGQVAGARVTRPSGIAEFDENCRQAVLRAAPFDPLPPELGAQLSWAMPFDAKNPAVRTRDPSKP